MKKLLGFALALSMLLNAALLLRKPQPPVAAVARPPVIERTVLSEPQIVVVPRTDPAPVPLIVSAPTVVAAPPVVHLLAAPSDVGNGGTVTVTCIVLSGKASPRHWIGLYADGAKVASYSAYLMVHDGAEYVFKAPRAPGTYEFRYVLEDDLTAIAASNSVRVYDEPASRPMVDLQSVTTVVKAGGEIPASWTLFSGKRSPQDWIGLYAPGAKNEDFLTWKYVTDADRGQVTLQAPDKPGMYEMRYLLDNGYESVATSIRIVVLP